jgi:NAD(P)-dependent dehydrogenase (short-subunit alcohol dehydrogenase family)
MRRPPSETRPTSTRDAFSLTGRVAVITGGAGLLGQKHAEAVAEMGGHPILLDLNGDGAVLAAGRIETVFGVRALGLCTDITRPESISEALSVAMDTFGRVDILINNAANNPKVEDADDGSAHWSRLENLPLDVWQQDLAVGLTGAFLCSQIIGSELARRGKGVILNIASDLGVIAPDQRIYRKPGLLEEQQMAKPVTYSVVKTGLIGLTRYLATYWAGKGVRANAISPGGVYAGQEEAFVERLAGLIPMARMAHADEYKSAIVFLVSDASSYMTGANLSIDGGRSSW